MGELLASPSHMTDIIKKHSPWSWTKMKTLHDCSQKFYYCYVIKKKLPPPEIEKFKIGNEVHRFLSRGLRNNNLKTVYDQYIADDTNEENMKLIISQVYKEEITPFRNFLW